MKGEKKLNRIGKTADLCDAESLSIIIDYLNYRSTEPFLFRLEEGYGVETENIMGNFLNRVNDPKIIPPRMPGSRWFRVEQLLEFIFVITILKYNTLLNTEEKVYADIGCENSCLPLFVSTYFNANTYGLDKFESGYGAWFSENVLSKCKNNILTLLNINNKKTIYKKEDAESLSFPDEFFDVISCISTIEHIQNDGKAMKEIGRVLKPNGVAMLTFPISLMTENENFEDTHDTRIYDIKTVFSRLINPSNLHIVNENINFDFDDKDNILFENNEKQFFIFLLCLQKLGG